jgi:hypothetical protein
MVVPIPADLTGLGAQIPEDVNALTCKNGVTGGNSYGQLQCPQDI